MTASHPFPPILQLPRGGLPEQGEFGEGIVGNLAATLSTTVLMAALMNPRRPPASGTGAAGTGIENRYTVRVPLRFPRRARLAGHNETGWRRKHNASSPVDVVGATFDIHSEGAGVPSPRAWPWAWLPRVCSICQRFVPVRLAKMDPAAPRPPVDPREQRLLHERPAVRG